MVVIPIHRALVLVVPVFQGDHVGDEFVIGYPAEEQFFANALLVVTGDFVTVPVVIDVFVGHVVEGQTSGGFLIVDPGFHIGNFEVGLGFGVAAEFPPGVDAVADAQEVLVADADHTQEAVGITVAGANAEGTSAGLHHGDFHGYGVGHLARVQADIHVFKVTQVVDLLHAPARQLGVEGFALLYAHFPDDDVILGLGVALHPVVFNDAFADLHDQGAIIQHPHIADLGQDVALFAVKAFHLPGANAYVPGV